MDHEKLERMFDEMSRLGERRFRADGSRKTQPTRSSKRHASRKAGKAAKQARKANR